MFGRLLGSRTKKGTDRQVRSARNREPRVIQGFVFGGLSADVPSIRLAGAAATWIDLMVAHRRTILKWCPEIDLTNGNWKLQAENSVDGYHVSTVHASSHTVRRRKARANTAVLEKRVRAHRGRCADGVLRSGQWPHGDLGCTGTECGLSGKRKSSSRNRLNGS